MMDKKNSPTDDAADRKWPNTVRSHDELDLALESGEKNGISKRTIDEIFESGIAKAKNG